jgi:DNA-3-methyladenine glycosylase
MFGPPGHLYVYFTYGMHWGSNAVCGEVGEGVGVLLRAAEPLQGLTLMQQLRPAARRTCDLANGPGKLSQAFGLDRDFDGADLVLPDRGISIISDGMAPPLDPVVGPRIGLTRAMDFPWRWHVRGNPHVSRNPGPRQP